MTNKIQILSINLLNSKYRFILALSIYFLIYICFYNDKMLAFCMNEASLLSIAEAKPIRSVTRSIIQREVSAFVGFSEEIEKYKHIIEEKDQTISDLERKINRLKSVNRNLEYDLEAESEKHKNSLKKITQTHKRETVQFQEEVEELQEKNRRLRKQISELK
jgi:predicted RNase H-like nuclease (RuvC/YqgF family)